MSPYDAVLFDNDGVLVEPPAPETQRAAIREAFRAVGVNDPDDRHVEDLTSGVTVETLERLGAAYEVGPEALWAARERHDERSQLKPSGPATGTATTTPQPSRTCHTTVAS